MDLALVLNNLVKKSHRLKTLITGNYTASQYDSILLDSLNSSFTIKLPSNPMIGARLPLFDVGGYLSVHNVILDGNGSTINDQSTINLSGDNAFYEVVYYNLTEGWKLVVSPSSDGSSTSSSGISGLLEPLVDNTSELIFDQTGDLISTVI